MRKAADDTSSEKWIKEQRVYVEEYLRRAGVQHLGIGKQPAFAVPPYLALWGVQSKKSPGSIGWWAITGDLPADAISSSEGRHPREAIHAFSRRWFELSSCMIAGKAHPDHSIGRPEDWPTLGQLLKRRAEILGDYAGDDELWAE